MQDLIFSIGGFIIAIGILVAVHEYGHYQAARWCNVKVLRFSVGFGKTIWSRIAGKDNTEYAIAAIPLGGYVKMLDEAEGDVPAREQHRAFNRQPLLKRVFIVISGPLTNFLFAVLAYTTVNMIGQQGLEPVVESVRANSYAEQAGFQSGDRIVAIDGNRQREWDDNRLYLYNSALKKKVVEFEVENAAGDIQIRRVDLGQIGEWKPSEALLETTLGLYPLDTLVETVIGEILNDSPAAAGGLEIDDRIIAMDGQAIENWQELVEYVSARPDQPIELLIEKPDGTLVTRLVHTGSVMVDGQATGRIGISNIPQQIPPEKLVVVRDSLMPALSKGLASTWQMSTLTLRMLWKMLKLEISPKNISGPITIAEYAGKTAQVGLNSYLMFLAVISISLGIINLLPVPMLDGGHLLMYLIEAIKGGPLSDGALIAGQKIGLLILGALMFLAFYNDFARLVQ